MSLRLAHFSDIHLTARPLRLGPLDWFGKRSAGWLNAKIGRGRRFVDANTIVAIMADDLKGRGHDHVVFSGDATTIGLRIEFEEVERVLRPGDRWPPALAVPGNHDYYTRRAARAGEFERVFAPWQRGERIGDHTYPFAQKVGPLWLVAVNSADANMMVWDSRGRVGVPQLDRVSELLNLLPPGPRIMVTHYPLCLADGRQETRWRRLRDAYHLRELATNAGVRLWLHGHRHASYFRRSDASLPFAVACAGSATQAGRWSYNEYTFAEGLMHGRRRVWMQEAGQFVDGDEFEMPFPLELSR